MVKFYAEKIKKCVINQITRDVWKLEDVPKVWREGVLKELDKIN